MLARELQRKEQQHQPPRWAMYPGPHHSFERGDSAIELAKNYVMEDIQAFPAGGLHPTKTKERSWHPTAVGETGAGLGCVYSYLSLMYRQNPRLPKLTSKRAHTHQAGVHTHTHT